MGPIIYVSIFLSTFVQVQIAAGFAREDRLRVLLPLNGFQSSFVKSVSNFLNKHAYCALPSYQKMMSSDAHCSAELQKIHL